MARTKRTQPGKKHRDDDQQSKEPPVTPAPSDANLGSASGEVSDVPSNLDQELEDDLWGFLDEEVRAEKQGDEEVGGEGEGVEETPEQVVDDMDIDRNGDDDEKEETEEELLDQIKKNWGITSLRSIMELGLDTVKDKQLKDTWLSGETDLADEEWDKITLRLFRDLSRLTRNNFDKARSILGEWLRYRKHDKDGKRTGSKRVTHKEPKLRNDLRGIIYDLQTTKEKAQKKKGKDQGKPMKKKAKTDDSSDVDLDDGLYHLEVEPPLEKGKKASEKKGSSKTPGGNSANRSKSRQDSGDDSDSSPSEVPPKDPRKEKSAEAGVKVKKKPAQSKQNEKAKPKAAEAEAASNESLANEPPPVTIIQNDEERNAALQYIYINWRTTSLLHVLPGALHPVEATKDQNLAYEIVAALRNLSNVIRTPDELAAFRQDLEDQVAGDTSYTNEDIVAHIMRVGEPYYHAARAAGAIPRPSAVQSAAGQPQTEGPTSRGPTTRRSPRNHNTSAIPPAGGQQAAAAPALDLLAAAAAGRLRETVTTPQPPRPIAPRTPQPAPGASAATQDETVAKSNNGNEGTAQGSEQPTSQEAAGSMDASGQSSTANNTQGQAQPPRPPMQPADLQSSRFTPAVPDNDTTFRLVSALSRVRNSEADVRVAQIQRDIAALQGQSAYAQANASLEVALKERQRAEAEMEANSFQGYREGMQTREEVVRQREEELRRIRRGDVGVAEEGGEGEEDGESRQKTKRRKIGDGGKSGDEGDMSDEGNVDGGAR
ncbi:uncharacterized protein J4E84_010042 [Alternaria hordeiaustralica]|uniref:uncharacterized protein n=1 Tax=Alternaria hordeiaustralica TaxID=1187925 RepID=UPI0020C4CE8E|nr:uncharacterized protein J4E84_010042 [Alternaria hordeiaustralica]KAI4675447.1 hypothetical protein J4E84_010042 [Alternaria hordeiaustralica]